MKTTFTSALVLVSVAAGLTTGCISHDETVYQDTERIPVNEFLSGLHIFYDLLSSEY